MSGVSTTADDADELRLLSFLAAARGEQLDIPPQTPTSRSFEDDYQQTDGIELISGLHAMLQSTQDASTPNSMHDTPQTPQPQLPLFVENAKPRIDNVVTSIKLHLNKDETLDLTQIARKAKNSQYNKGRFPAVITRLANSEKTATVMIFQTGRIMAYGPTVSDSALNGRRALGIIKMILSDQFPSTRKVKYTSSISMIHACASLPFRVNIEGLSIDLPRETNYFPEWFAGVVYSILEPRAKCVIFTSGKVQIIAKSEEAIEKAMERLRVVLADFKAVETKKPKSCFVERRKKKKLKL